MKRTTFCLLVCVLFALIGCKVEQPSLNKQLAAINGATQVATAVVFDNSSEEKVPERITKTKAIVKKFRQLLMTGEVGQFTLAELNDELTKLVPEGYESYVDMVTDCLVGVRVPTDKVGERNVARILEVLDAVEYRCNRYRIINRKKVPRR